MIGVVTKEQAEYLIEHGEEFFNKIHLPEEKLDTRRVFDFWMNQHRNGTGCFLVSFEGNEFNALLGLVFTSNPFNDDITATVMQWYSEGKDGLRLFNVAERFAKVKGATEMVVMHMSYHPRLEKFYKKRGFSSYITQYRKEL